MHVLKGKEYALIKASLDGGCTRFDTAMNGFGGCPLAADELAGNLGAEVLLRYLENEKYKLSINTDAFMQAQLKAQALFSKYE